MDPQSSSAPTSSLLSSSALAVLASHLSSDVCDVKLLRLRLRLGSPRCVASGVAFRIVLDLVDEMAQPPATTLASTLKSTVDVLVKLDASCEDSFELVSCRRIKSSSSSLQWKFECVIAARPDVLNTAEAVRLHVSWPSHQPAVRPTDSHALLRSFCVASQWIYTPDQRSQLLILAVVSDKIRVVPLDDAVSPSAQANSSLCLRTFAVPSTALLQIEEDYGEAMGSHIWDASIFLSLALIASFQLNSDEKKTDPSPPLTMLELGAGCGLFAVVFARLMSTRSQSSRMVLTEKGNSIARIKDNLQRNGVELDQEVCVSELVWGANVEDVVSDVRPVDVIFAADVLYHWSAHEALLATLEALVAKDSDTPVLIAHKHRGKATAERIEGMLRSGYDELCDVKDTAKPVNTGFACRWAQWHVDRLARVANVDVLKLTRQKI